MTSDGCKGYEVRGAIGPVVLDPNTYCPKRTLKIEVDVPMNSHGGRQMSEGMINLQESDLTDKIMSELRFKVLEYVKSIDPFLRGLNK